MASVLASAFGINKYKGHTISNAAAISNAFAAGGVEADAFVAASAQIIAHAGCAAIAPTLAREYMY